MSLYPFVSFQSRFVTYLLTFPRTFFTVHFKYIGQDFEHKAYSFTQKNPIILYTTSKFQVHTDKIVRKRVIKRPSTSCLN